jgi:DUF218 domain
MNIEGCLEVRSVGPRKAESASRWALGGLLKRKEVWLPTWRGWLTGFALSAVVFFSALLTVHPFLAVTVRPQPDVLVIDGWIPDYALWEGWQEFQNGHYSTLLTVGGPFRGGLNLDPNDNYADLAAYSLRKMAGQGIPVQPVRCPLEERDRTFTSAITVKAWLAQHHQTPTTVTVVTLGTHARRSRLLYQRAFGPDVRLGVIALENEEYDTRHWWRYSEGVKEVISESSAYLYARMFFHLSLGK